MPYTSSDLLKKVLETRKKPTIVLGAVERHLLSLTSTRSTDVLHPSEITKSDWCVRRSWFLLNGYPAPIEAPNLRLANIFAEGHAIHAKWQGWLTDLNALIGVWECPAHGTVWWGKRQDSHEHCPVRYQEVPVYQNQTPQIEGHADGWVTGITDQDYLLEVKSIGLGTVRANKGRIDKGGLAKTFQSISKPYNAHIRQAMLYLYLLKQMYRENELPQKPPEKLLFLYECKEDQNVREFVVDYDEEFLEPVFKKLYFFDPEAPIPPKCSNNEDSLCSQCEPFGSL